MTRKIYITARQMWNKRQFWYADHYQKREIAKTFSMDQAIRTLKALEQMPEPTLEITGCLCTRLYSSNSAKPIDEQIQLLQDSGSLSELFVKWYWSDTYWEDFVRQFNNLPEPEPLYELVMIDNHAEWKVVPYIMGTTQYNSKIVHTERKAELRKKSVPKSA